MYVAITHVNIHLFEQRVCVCVCVYVCLCMYVAMYVSGRGCLCMYMCMCVCVLWTQRITYSFVCEFNILSANTSRDSC